MRRVALSILCLSLAGMAGCAPKLAPLPTVSSPRFPDFVAPVVPADFANTAAADAQARGWTYLQGGDLKSAERMFGAALKVTPAFYPAEIGLGYVALADRDPKTATAHFDRALTGHPGEAAALVGRGEARLGLNQEGAALTDFEAAVAADSSLTQIAQRVEVLKFRGAEQRLADARAAAKAGRFDDAITAYTSEIAASPSSAFLYRELAGVERQKGDLDAALAHYTSALDLDRTDAATLIAVGEVHEARGAFGLAVEAYQEALGLEPGDALRKKLDGARARDEMSHLPAEYRAIDTSAQVTRGELAALMGFRLGSVLIPDPRADSEPITDIRNDWAANWILKVTRAGVMEPFANHAFQPRTVIRRIDLAQAVTRLLTRIAPQKAPAWESTQVPFTDLAASHIAYPAASTAVAAGVLATAPDGSFGPSRDVSGAEAVDAIRRLEVLAGIPSVGPAPQ
jgi:tetratricopeptide (TPR) repeat protein